MRGMMQQAGFDAGLFEGIAERLLGEWLAALSDDEGEIADRAGIKCRLASVFIRSDSSLIEIAAPIADSCSAAKILSLFDRFVSAQ